MNRPAEKFGPQQKKILARLRRGARLAVELGDARRRFYWTDGAPAPREESVERLIARGAIIETGDGMFDVSQTMALNGGNAKSPTDRRERAPAAELTTSTAGTQGRPRPEVGSNSLKAS